MRVRISDDFDMEKIANCGQCFRARQMLDSYLFITGKRALLMKKVSKKTYEVSCTPYAWKHHWRCYFDLERDYKSIRESYAFEDGLKAMIKRGIGIRILRQDPWEMLITFVISQRKTIPAIRSSVEKLCTLFGESIEVDGHRVHLFPSAKSLYKASDEALARCGLGYRLPYIRAILDKVVREKISFKEMECLSTKDLFAALTSFHGVGEKVANCILLFGYGRMEVAPVDVWIHRYLESAKENPFTAYPSIAGILQQYIFYHMVRAKE